MAVENEQAGERFFNVIAELGREGRKERKNESIKQEKRRREEGGKAD